MPWILWGLFGACVLTVSLVLRAFPQPDPAVSLSGTAASGQPAEFLRPNRDQRLRRLCRVVGTCVWYSLVLVPLRPPGTRSGSPGGSAWRRAVARPVLTMVAVSAVAMPGGSGDLAATARVFNAVRLAPVTAPAVVWGLAHGGRLGWDHGMAVVSGMREGFGPREGVTVGSVHLTGSSPETLPARMVEHERRHVTQWSAFGLLFPPLYWAAGRAGRIADLGDAGAGNVFEIAAGLRAGGYVKAGALEHEGAGHGWRADLTQWLDPSSRPRGPQPPAGQSVASSPARYVADPKEIQFRFLGADPAPSGAYDPVMISRLWAKRAVAGSALTLAVPLAACSEVSGALGTAGGAVDKAQACSDALGIVTSFDPESLSPQQIKQQAGEKAQQLRELGDKVSDAGVQNALFGVADAYVGLERRQAEQLENVNGWVQNNVDRIKSLKQVCL